MIIKTYSNDQESIEFVGLHLLLLTTSGVSRLTKYLSKSNQDFATIDIEIININSIDNLF